MLGEGALGSEDLGETRKTPVETFSWRDQPKGWDGRRTEPGRETGLESFILPVRKLGVLKANNRISNGGTNGGHMLASSACPLFRVQIQNREEKQLCGYCRARGGGNWVLSSCGNGVDSRALRRTGKRVEAHGRSVLARGQWSRGGNPGAGRVARLGLGWRRERGVNVIVHLAHAGRFFVLS